MEEQNLMEKEESQIIDRNKQENYYDHGVSHHVVWYDENDEYCDVIYIPLRIK